MSSLLIKNARAIVTADDCDSVYAGANLYAEDGVIKEIQAPERDADVVIDAKNLVVYPGLVNTHHHLYQTFTRNLPQVQNMELFDWLKTLYQLWKGLTREHVYYSALTGMGELIRYGCTTVMDHHYVFPRVGSSGFIDAQFEAASLLGARFYATRGSMSLGESQGGLPPDELVQSTDEILKDSERLVRLYHDPSRFSTRRVALAPCSPFSVTADLLRESAALARKLGVRLHTHLCETKDEEDFCVQKVGMRPLDYMESLGWTGSDVWFAHGIHFNDDEILRLAKTKTGVAHCPASNMKLSSGVCRLPDMLKYGVPVALAVDGSASNDCSNLLSEIRIAYLMARLNWSNLSPTGYDMLKIATRGGADVLGMDYVGSLSPGMAADMFLIDVDSPDFAGTLGDYKSLLATVGYARPVKYTIVAGRVICEDGHLVNADEEEIFRKANALAGGLSGAI
ncbi:MAG: 8-oxoguanine deaminase [Clostridia bacterium]|nr:8-oxoguanine deaminase [Clostridia bacterium]